MKSGIVVAGIIASVSGIAAVRAQDERMFAGFDIAVTRTATGVSLACNAGCSWMTLDIPLTLSGRPTPVNERGVADDKTAKPGEAGAFLIRLGINDDGFALSCDRGCAWRTIGWSFPSEGASTRINEYGMAPNRKPISGQHRPDFTGVSSRVDPPSTSDSSHVVQIEQQGSLFTVRTQKSFLGGALAGERTYVIGAPPESRKDSDGRVLTLSVDWQDDALVFLKTTLEGLNTTTEREVWSISTDRTRLTRSRRTTDWRGTSTTQSRFQKR